MPMMYPCAKGELCPYHGTTGTAGELCQRCREDEQREQERYMRLMQKDSRVRRNKKGWRK